MRELIFDVVQESDGGFCAECRTASIFAEGDSWAGLRDDVRGAVQAFFFDQPAPTQIHLRGAREERFPAVER